MFLNKEDKAKKRKFKRKAAATMFLSKLSFASQFSKNTSF